MNIQQIIANSYRNFHARGLDYLCLKRTPELTIKVYFFDGPEGQLSHLPEIVAPHDHRYNFDSHILRGRVSNILFEESDDGDGIYQKFEWRTPLLGGDGFRHVSEVRLKPGVATPYRRDGFAAWHTRHDRIHTLSIDESGSILMLRQYADVVPVDVPTTTYTRGNDPQAPSLAGLYEEMDEATVMQRIEQIRHLIPDLEDAIA